MSTVPPKRPESGMLVAALQYAQMGIPVFPCKPRGKDPLTRLAGDLARQIGAAATNDYDPAVTAFQIVYDVPQSPYAFPDPADDPAPIIADLQRWLDDPATNFGWIFICESETVAHS